MGSATRTSRTAGNASTAPGRCPRAESCPRCGGQLAVNQDGWKICHACGYASPPGAAPPPRSAHRGIVAPTVAGSRGAG
ncbi:hypothetical protein C3486_06285 [Streptomyces sp. Ru73]|nr:hypothetical protein C3486_06285 [Streptomyces sp. Ru73]